MPQSPVIELLPTKWNWIADAKFWVGRGQKPTASGGIRIPDENGRETPLRKYDQKTIVLTLPGDLTVFDIGNVAIRFIQI